MRYINSVSFFLLLFSSQLCFALENSAVDLFGLQRYIAPEFRESLSPAIAHNLLSTGILRHLYLLGAEGVEFSEDPLRKDLVIRLIRTLFTMIEGDDSSLRVTKLEGNFSYHLGAQEIALAQRWMIENSVDMALKPEVEVVTQLSTILSESLNQDVSEDGSELLRVERDVSRAEGKLQKEIQEAILSRFMVQEIKKAEKSDLEKKGKLEAAIAELKSDFNKENIEYLSALFPEWHSHPKFLHVKAELLSRVSSVALQKNSIQAKKEKRNSLSRRIQKYDPKPFVRTLVRAYRAAHTGESLYPKVFVYQILNSFLLLKSEHYLETLKQIWKRLPLQVLTPDGQGFLGLSEDSQYIPLRLSREHFEVQLAGVLLTPPNIVRPTFMTNFEDTLSYMEYARDVGNLGVIPLMNQGLHDVEFEVQSQKIKSSDCCEASFWNVFLQLAQLKEKTDKFVGFFSRFNDGLRRGEPLSFFRSDWKLLASNLPTLSYLETMSLPGGGQFRFDLSPSVDNLIGLLAEVYGLQELFASKPTRKEKLEKFCELVGCNVAFDSPEPSSEIPWKNVRVNFFTPVERLSEHTAWRQILQLQILDKHCSASGPPYINPFQRGLALKYRVRMPVGPIATHVLARLGQSFPGGGGFWAVNSVSNPGLNINTLMIVLALPAETPAERAALYEFVKGSLPADFHPYAEKYRRLDEARSAGLH